MNVYEFIFVKKIPTFIYVLRSYFVSPKFTAVEIFLVLNLELQWSQHIGVLYCIVCINSHLLYRMTYALFK